MNLRGALVGCVVLTVLLGGAFICLYNENLRIHAEIGDLQSYIEELEGQGGGVTLFENVEIQSAYTLKVDGYWVIMLVLKNKGSANSTLIKAYINNQPIDYYTPDITWYYINGTGNFDEVSPDGFIIVSGAQLTIYLVVDDSLFASGTTLNVKLHSAGGMDYIKLVQLDGLAGEYTKFEKVDILSAYAPLTATCWNMTLVLKNTGWAEATLINAYINNKPIGEYTPTINCPQITTGGGLTISSGEQVTLYIEVPLSLFTSGTTLNVKLHSAGGMDYIKLVELT